MIKHKNTTIVTCYYRLNKNKYNSDYLNWISNYLPNIDNPMIIFTDEKSKDVLTQFREGKETKFIIREIEDLYCHSFIEYWIKDNTIDHERMIHNPYLYILWNEKTMLLKISKELNPFNTDYFCYTDIGMIREQSYIEHISHFPNDDFIKSLDKNKVHLLNIEPFTREDLMYNDATERFRYLFNSRIGGGVILLHKDIVDKWTEEYYCMLLKFINNNLFAGKDQSIMACVYLKNRENLINLINHEESPLNYWFYMIYYLGNKHLKND